MRQVSAFIIELAKVISDDLRDHTAPDKLRYEVEMELQKQVLSQLVHAIGEYNGLVTYQKKETAAISAARKKCLRFMGYCSEMWVKQDLVKGVLGAGLADEVDYTVSL